MQLVLQLKEALQITFSVVIDFLLPINDQINFGEVALANHPVVQACARVLSVWLTEDSEAHSEGAITLLPLFLKIASNPEVSLMNTLIPMFLHLTTTESTREAFIEQGGVGLLAEDLLLTLSRPPPTPITKEFASSTLMTLETLLNLAMLAPLSLTKEPERLGRLFKALATLVGTLTADISGSGNATLSLLGSTLLMELSISKNLSVGAPLLFLSFSASV